jgi:hypothetical protein
MNQYSGFFKALKKLPGLSKEEAVYDFTSGRTRSLQKLDYWEVQELTRCLAEIAGKVQVSRQEDTKKTDQFPGGEKADKMRKAIIAIFRKMGKTVPDAITWAERQGVKGVKKGFNEYTTGELYVLIGIAEKILGDVETKIRTNANRL